MSTITKPEALIFDMDGTLFQTETLLLPSYEQMFRRLRAEGLYEEEAPDPSIILGTLGMLLRDIWKRVLPEHDEAVHRRADVLLLEEQLEGLTRGVGTLYPGVKETLERLKAQGYRLFVASNGLEHYVKGVAEATGILPLFEYLYSAGEHKTETKVELVRKLLTERGVGTAWMVGDRSSDVEAGAANRLPVVGCQYADFGVKEQELSGADMKIRSFPELLRLLGE
ncbi:HAD family hydrolase [Paenibacillus thermotolerans]|uniref:HAD family hydrolase n=1 Tax=Paenibacillus thermotolerans TaxID=3027807 RepID=UPI0023675E89|nr:MULTISPECIES: HAD family hydrolase [unclassified Paenibacillus]